MQRKGKGKEKKRLVLHEKKEKDILSYIQKERLPCLSLVRCWNDCLHDRPIRSEPM